jgi:hypothetical protein
LLLHTGMRMLLWLYGSKGVYVFRCCFNNGFLYADVVSIMVFMYADVVSMVSFAYRCTHLHWWKMTTRSSQALLTVNCECGTLHFEMRWLLLVCCECEHCLLMSRTQKKDNKLVSLLGMTWADLLLLMCLQVFVWGYKNETVQQNGWLITNKCSV